jgi:hypothetical protein
MRALMLVLPYHSEKLTSEDLHEIYTKRPITKIVSNTKNKEVQSYIVKVPETLNPVPNKATTFRPQNKPVAAQLQVEEIPSTLYTKTTVPKKYVTKGTQKPLVKDDVENILSTLRIGDHLSVVSTTESPDEKLELSPDFQKLLQSYGLINEDGASIGLKPLPALDSDSGLLISGLLENQKFESSSRQNGRKKPGVIKTTITTTSTTTEAPEKLSITSLLKPLDYTGFKPLKIDEKGMDQDMEEFLKQFGLIDTSTNRNKKAMKSENENFGASAFNNLTEAHSMPVVDSDLFSEDHMSILDNLGIKMDKKKSRKINQKSAANIFKPTPEKSKSDQDDYKKLEQLLETIKELDRLNANLTEDELNRLDLKRFNLSDVLLAQGPSPLEFVRNTQQFPSKNEIKKKRQNSDDERLRLDLLQEESNGNSSQSSLEIISTTNNDQKDGIIEALNLEKETTSTEPSTTTTSTTEEARNKLEDELEPAPEEEEPLPLPRRSGFYFLADWNSFLEVGQDDEKIVVKFDPKIGDPTRFIPVTVP